MYTSKGIDGLQCIPPISIGLVRNYQVGTMIPQTRLKAKWTGSGQAVEDDVRVNLTGVTEPCSFLLLCTSG